MPWDDFTNAYNDFTGWFAQQNQNREENRLKQEAEFRQELSKPLNIGENLRASGNKIAGIFGDVAENPGTALDNVYKQAGSEINSSVSSAFDKFNNADDYGSSVVAKTANEYLNDTGRSPYHKIKHIFNNERSKLGDILGNKLDSEFPGIQYSPEAKLAQTIGKGAANLTASPFNYLPMGQFAKGAGLLSHAAMFKLNYKDKKIAELLGDLNPDFMDIISRDLQDIGRGNLSGISDKTRFIDSPSGKKLMYKMNQTGRNANHFMQQSAIEQSLSGMGNVASHIAGVTKHHIPTAFPVELKPTHLNEHAALTIGKLQPKGTLQLLTPENEATVAYDFINPHLSAGPARSFAGITTDESKLNTAKTIPAEYLTGATDRNNEGNYLFSNEGQVIPIDLGLGFDEGGKGLITKRGSWDGKTQRTPGGTKIMRDDKAWPEVSYYHKPFELAERDINSRYGIASMDAGEKISQTDPENFLRFVDELGPLSTQGNSGDYRFNIAKRLDNLRDPEFRKALWLKHMDAGSGVYKWPF